MLFYFILHRRFFLNCDICNYSFFSAYLRHWRNYLLNFWRRLFVLLWSFTYMQVFNWLDLLMRFFSLLGFGFTFIITVATTLWNSFTATTAYSYYFIFLFFRCLSFWVAMLFLLFIWLMGCCPLKSWMKALNGIVWIITDSTIINKRSCRVKINWLRSKRITRLILHHKLQHPELFFLHHPHLRHLHLVHSFIIMNVTLTGIHYSLLILHCTLLLNLSIFNSNIRGTWSCWSLSPHLILFLFLLNWSTLTLPIVFGAWRTIFANHLVRTIFFINRMPVMILTVDTPCANFSYWGVFVPIVVLTCWTILAHNLLVTTKRFELFHISQIFGNPVSFILVWIQTSSDSSILTKRFITVTRVRRV